MNGLPRLAFIFDNAGVDEWLVLGVVVFILFGPRRLPEIARTIGRTLARIRQAADEFREQMTHLEEEVSSSSLAAPSAGAPGTGQQQLGASGQVTGARPQASGDNGQAPGDETHSPGASSQAPGANGPTENKPTPGSPTEQQHPPPTDY